MSTAAAPTPSVNDKKSKAKGTVQPESETTKENVGTNTTANQETNIASNSSISAPDAAITSVLRNALVNQAAILSFVFPSTLLHAPTRGRLWLLSTSTKPKCVHSFSECLCASCKDSVRKKSVEDKEAHAIYMGSLFAIDTEILGDTLQCSSNSTSKGSSKLAKNRRLISIPSYLCDNCKKHATNEYHLTGGRFGKSLLTEAAVKTAALYCEDEDILIAYDRQNKLTKPEERMFISSLDKRTRDRAHRPFDPKEVLDRFKSLPVYAFPQEQSVETESVSSGSTIYWKYEDVQAVVTAMREEAIATLRQSFPDVIHKGKEREEQRRFNRDIQEPPYLSKLTEYMLTQATTRSENKKELTGISELRKYTLDQRILHRFTHEMSELEEVNNSNLCANGRLIRDSAFLHNREAGWS